MDRAYCQFEIKAVNEEERTFEGIATTPTADRMGDIIDPMGAVLRTGPEMPMLWQHGRGSIEDPVGWIMPGKPTKTGIPVKGRMAIPKPDYPQGLADDLNRAWVMVRDKLMRGLSIGFNPLEWEPIKGSFGTYFKLWDWLETSPVAIAANYDASISRIKSIDRAQRAAVAGIQRGAVQLLTARPVVSGPNAAKRGPVILIPRNPK